MRRCVRFLSLKFIREAREKPDIRNRYCFRRSYSSMTKRSTVLESAVRIFLRLVWSAPPRPCIRTGCPCPEQAIFPACTRNTKKSSAMGCRAFLSPWYERGGMEPADENDTPVFVGRFNIGAVSLHLPMILAKARGGEQRFL